MRYLLDTTLLLDYVHEHPGAIRLLGELFSEWHELYSCDVVVCEALSGGSAVERRALRTLLDALEYVAVDPAAARWAAESRRVAREDGRRRGLGDALIAGLAVGLGATVVSRDRPDFARQGVPVREY